MTLSKVSVALFASFLSFSTFAAENLPFHHEAEVGFLDSSEDSDGLVNAKYSYYFTAVEQTEIPYQLATFLNQGAVISARYATTEYQDLYALSGEYVFDSKWFIGAEYLKIANEKSFLNLFDDVDTYYINTGYYFSEGSKLTLGYTTSSQSESRYLKGSYFEVDEQQSRDFDLYSLTYEHFLPFESTSGLFLTAGINYQKTANNRYASGYTLDGDLQPDPFDTHIIVDNSTLILGVEADWYINNAWSVGVATSYLQLKMDYPQDEHRYNDNQNISNINTQYYWHFSDIFSAKFVAQQVFVDSDSETNLGVAINARF